MSDVEVSRPTDPFRALAAGTIISPAPDAPERVPLDDSVSFDTSLIWSYFPMPSFRPGQEEAIETILKAFNKGKRLVLIEAPTGSGKSAIAYTVAQYFRDSYWLTIQKILQGQIVSDFGEGGRYVRGKPVIDLKGRNAYWCNFWERSLTAAKADGSYKAWDAEKKRIFNDLARGIGCDAGYCRRNGESKHPYCFPDKVEGYNLAMADGVFSYCPYWERKAEALRSNICLMNFSSFLFQTRAVRAFGVRDLMIIDECHNAESQLMSFIELKISDRYFRQDGITFPKKDSPLEYAEYFLEIDLETLIKRKIDQAKIDEDVRAEEEWTQILFKFQIFIESSDQDNWVSEFQDSTKKMALLDKKKTIQNVVTLKPIFVNEYARRYMFSMADRVLMMSATILSSKLVAESLGIDPEEAYSYRMANRFPVENRKIFFDPCGSLNMRNKKETFPRLVEKVNEITEMHEGQRGIIHTHNFEIARLLMEECAEEARIRFLFQEEWDNKNEMLDFHMRANDTIIVAPAMHEGLDLKDDRARFAIICKVPYPSMGDPQIKARMERQETYYDWLTALKLVQSYGRTIRSEEDWSVTYIVDGGFERFYDRSQKRFIPEWFSEALER